MIMDDLSTIRMGLVLWWTSNTWPVCSAGCQEYRPIYCNRPTGVNDRLPYEYSTLLLPGTRMFFETWKFSSLVFVRIPKNAVPLCLWNSRNSMTLCFLSARGLVRGGLFLCTFKVTDLSFCLWTMGLGKKVPWPPSISSHMSLSNKVSNHTEFLSEKLLGVEMCDLWTASYLNGQWILGLKIQIVFPDPLRVVMRFLVHWLGSRVQEFGFVSIYLYVPGVHTSLKWKNDVLTFSINISKFSLSLPCTSR